MSEPRDYSEVTWPWEGDPSWAKPREGATSHPADQANWAIVCRVCELRFPVDITVGTMADLWDTLHADEHGSSADGNLAVNLVWIGLGTPPQPPKGIGP